MDKHSIVSLLTKHQVPFDKWGHGEAKTLGHLVSEVSSSETTLAEDEEHGLVRRVCNARVEIFYQEGEDIFQLVEEKQIFSDGRVRRRGFAWIGEKLNLGESYKEGARRAIAEELGISESIPLVKLRQVVSGPMSSLSFPGLKSIYTIQVYQARMPKRLFKQGGYIEEQRDKTTYFVWRKV